MAHEARVRIDEEMRILRSRRNALSPISRLPFERLVAIFIHCALDHHCDSSHVPIEDVPSWVNLSYVCRHWRNVALGCPALWTYHFVLSLRWTEELLARSKHASLKIRITFAESKSNAWWSNLMQKLAQHTDRIQELHLDFLDRFNSQILSRLYLPAPRLQDLRISVKCVPSEWCLEPFRGDTPALSTLKLTCCPVPWYCFERSALTTLSLEHPSPFQLDVKEFLAKLNCMQDLKHLFLKDALASFPKFLYGAAFSTYPKINLCHLSRLLIDAPLSAVTVFLSCVNIPGKTEVRLECSSEGNISPDDYTLLSSALARRFSMSGDQTLSCPTIRSLIVESYQTGRAHFTFGSLEHDCQWDSSTITTSDMPVEWDCSIPLKIAVYWNKTEVEEDHILDTMCFSIPLIGVESLHVIHPPSSLAFWRKLLEHLQNLRYLKLSRGYMPDLASILSHSDLTIRGPMEDRVGYTPSDHILVPHLEKVVLHQVEFSDDPDFEPVVTQSRLFNALLSTRYAPQGRLILN